MATAERHVRLFRNGRNQALHIPREFELEDKAAVIRKEGGRLIVEPVRKGQLLALLVSLEPLDVPFPTRMKAYYPAFFSGATFRCESRACQRSQSRCRFNQNSGPVLSASPSANAESALT